jgi:hypothetical protein
MNKNWKIQVQLCDEQVPEKHEQIDFNVKNVLEEPLNEDQKLKRRKRLDEHLEGLNERNQELAAKFIKE